MKRIARLLPPAIPSKGGVALTLPAALQGAARVFGSSIRITITIKKKKLTFFPTDPRA